MTTTTMTNRGVIVVDNAYPEKLADLLTEAGYKAYHVGRDLGVEGNDTHIRNYAVVNDGLIITTDHSDFSNMARQQGTSNRVFNPPCIRIETPKSLGGVSDAQAQFDLLMHDLPKVRNELRPGAFVELREGRDPEVTVEAPQNEFRYTWQPPPPEHDTGHGHGR